MVDILVGRCLLKERLNERKISRSQLMDITGMTNQQISNYINNEQVMSLKTCRKIAYAINCDIEELYEWKITK